MNYGRNPVPPAAASDQYLFRSFFRPVVCVVVLFCTMAAASASNAMQIGSEANCDLLDNVQTIGDATWVQKRDMIAGPRPAKAIRYLSVQSAHPEFPIFCTALGCMPALANGATVNLLGGRRASVGEYIQCELLTDEDIVVHGCIAYHHDCMHAGRCTVMHHRS